MYKWICLLWLIGATAAIVVGAGQEACIAATMAWVTLFLSVAKREWRE